MSRGRRRPSRDYRRHGRRRRAGQGRTLVWLVLIVVMVGTVALAIGRQAFSGPDAAVVETTTALTQKLLIREGLRREDVAALLDAETEISGARYLELTAAGARGRGLAKATRATSLEGFLFPATYEITSATTAEELVEQQIAAFQANTASIPYGYARSRNLTRFDVLTIAAMIEREVAVPSERQTVAAVIYNRLKAGIPLGIDATVQFAIGEWKADLTEADLNVDSPYNTRRFAGLPPGPIASPGADSIRAAARPAKVPTLFYVARNDGTGRHYFSDNSAQFEIDVQRSRANAG